MLEEAGHVFLITGEAVEGLRHHDIERAGTSVLQEFLVARPEPAGAAARGVTIGGSKLPVLPFNTLPTDPDLILDGGLALEVGAVSGVNHGAHGRVSWHHRFTEFWCSS